VGCRCAAPADPAAHVHHFRVLSNAVLVWNSVQFAEIVEAFQ
jgi:hypothetical protein